MTSPSSGISIANAPVSYGAFEVTVGIDPNVPDGVQVLDEVAAAGYAGIDLGPIGFLGNADELGERLAARGLGLAGAYLELPYAEPALLRDARPNLEAVLGLFDAVAPFLTGPAPRPTLADAGSAQRRSRPGQSVTDPSLGHDAATWRRFKVGLDEVVARCRDRGYEPTLHPETGTYVEAPWEIERVLDLTDIGLCLETGHMLLGGGDPLAAARGWGSRINHVHLKDADRSVMAAMIADGAEASAIWSRGAFPTLGNGDLEADAVIAALADIGFAGWLVVEQDTLPRTKERFEQAAADQRANRQFLVERGL